MDDDLNKELLGYRKLLVANEQKSQEDYDKTLISLSGGALGISFAFIENFLGNQQIINEGYLLAAWILWGFSLFSTLTSFYVSRQALRKAINQVDQAITQADTERIYSQTPGGFYSTLTAILNALGGIFFVSGVVSLVIFVARNI